jgi:type III pantothenate kinase
VTKDSSAYFLTVDVGNTSASVALFRNDSLVEVKSLRKPQALDLAAFLSRRKTQPVAGIYSSVVSRQPRWLSGLKRRMPLQAVQPGMNLPVNLLYRSPHSLGTDRLCGMAGARQLFPGQPVLVIDAGTCITYDILDRHGRYPGGSISPGMHMRLSALHDYTSRLPRVQPGPMNELTGRDTAGSILTGVLHGLAFEIAGFVSAYRKQYKGLRVVMTGGDMPRLVKLLKSDIFAAPHLIHLGLYEILRKNPA